MGFLHGRPKEFDGPNRWKKFETDFGHEPPLPEISDAEYLFDTLLQLGITSTRGETEVPVTWEAIHAYKECTGAISTPWECSLIREMSAAYIAGRAVGDDVFGIPPEE